MTAPANVDDDEIWDDPAREARDIETTGFRS